MCIVAIAWQHHPRWKLLAIGNRDELHARPASPIGRWNGKEHLIAGQDIQVGGTWLGISEQGRFAVVTNVAQTEPPSPDAASRGSLLKDFLSGDGQYANLDTIDYSRFNPFNLLTVSGDVAKIISNKSNRTCQELMPGVYGLSNGTLDHPWSKSALLNQSLESWLNNDAEDFEWLLSELRNQEPIADQGAISDETGRPPRPEYSSIFINNGVYGTRCSSIVAVEQDGTGKFIEERFNSNGQSIGQTDIDFSWPA